MIGDLRTWVVDIHQRPGVQVRTIKAGQGKCAPEPLSCASKKTCRWKQYELRCIGNLELRNFETHPGGVGKVAS